MEHLFHDPELSFIDALSFPFKINVKKLFENTIIISTSNSLDNISSQENCKI